MIPSARAHFPRAVPCLPGLAARAASMSISPYRWFSSLARLPLTRSRTETKAITTWGIQELTRVVPKLLHSHLRSSKHYVKNKDSLSFHAQTARDKNANADENRSKLLQELRRMYSDAVPGDTDVEKKQKHAAL